MDRLTKIKERISETGKSYDFTKDVEVTELFEDLEWLIRSLENKIEENKWTKAYAELINLNRDLREVGIMSKASGKAMQSKLTRDLREVGMSTKDFI